MDKLIISQTSVESLNKDQFHIQISQASRLLTILRDNHFKSCRIIPNSNTFTPNSYKFLINLMRVLTQNGQVIFETKGLTETAPVKKLLSSLGYFQKVSNDNQIIYSKSKVQQKKQQESQTKPLSIGFQKITIVQQKIDEDQLLKEDVVEKKAKVQSCQVKVKACSNCSCGRKQKQLKITKEEAVKALNEGKAKTSCGNCYLGDAFRCGTCPYKGLPAFKPGEKIELNLNEQIAIQSEVGNINIKGGKVKLQL